MTNAMTDNRTTEKLMREFVDAACECEVRDYLISEYAERIEQAIAATLGRQNATSDQESIVRSFLRKISPNRDWDYLGEHEHAMIADLVDDIAATLGSGTLTAEKVRKAIFVGGIWDEDNAIYYVNRTDMQTIADELNAMLCGGRVNEDSIDKWLREFQIAHGELAHIGPDELKDLAFALHDDIPLGYEASMRLGQWLLNAELGSGTCENVAPEYLYFLCSECGFVHYHSDENDSGDGNDWAFCPSCGRKVKR